MPYDFNEPEIERDFLQEALDIIEGHSLYLAQKEHLLALWNLIPTDRQNEIQAEVEVFREDWPPEQSPDVERSVEEVKALDKYDENMRILDHFR